MTLKGAPGGTIPFLVVDGICGPKTNAAIARFQQIQLKIFDGLVEPNKKTIVRLNEIIGPVSDADLIIRVRLAVPIVGLAISAALRNLQAVIANGPAATGPAAVGADRLNRHFRINTLSPSEQSDARIDLFGTYTRLNAVINEGLKTDEIKTALARFQALPYASTPQEFEAFLKDQLPKWASMVKLAGAKGE